MADHMEQGFVLAGEMGEAIGEAARLLADKLGAGRLTLATAESCTGGLLGAALTSVPGASEWYPGGVISYSNAVKTKLLGVGEDVLARYGAVSRECAAAMAEGVRGCIGAGIGIGITGIAGPGGGSAEKPVGTVWIGWSGPFGTETERFFFDGGRQEVREASVLAALWGVLDLL